MATGSSQGNRGRTVHADLRRCGRRLAHHSRPHVIVADLI
jgi:ribosomal protein L37E